MFLMDNVAFMDTEPAINATVLKITKSIGNVFYSHN